MRSAPLRTSELDHLEVGFLRRAIGAAEALRYVGPARSGRDAVVGHAGSLVHEGKEHRATTIIFVQPEEGPFRLVAGADGLEAVALNFPRPELPIAASAPASDADAEYKVWQCVLCAFVYDEAAGMPEDGIAPGTRWADVPENWGCPDCSAKKADFEMVEL